jgi:hypothetical protein
LLARHDWASGFDGALDDHIVAVLGGATDLRTISADAAS